MGIAPQSYADSRDNYHRRARESRALGLAVPGLDGEPIEDENRRSTFEHSYTSSSAASR